MGAYGIGCLDELPAFVQAPDAAFESRFVCQMVLRLREEGIPHAATGLGAALDGADPRRVGRTVADAIERSDIADAFPGVNLDGLQAGIWGSPAERNRLLREGDRVELYRPLAMDPREARRLKAGV